MAAQHFRDNALLTALDEAIQGGELAELHSHLMGMGSADFWVARVMQTYLPRLQQNADAPPVSGSSLRAAGSGTTQHPDRDSAVANIATAVTSLLVSLGSVGSDMVAVRACEAAVKSTLQGVPWWVVRHFTTDVVYSESRLLTACGIWPCAPTDEFAERAAAVSTMLDAYKDTAELGGAAHAALVREAAALGAGREADDWGASFARAELESRMFDEQGSAKECIKPYVVFNVKTMSFVPVVGLANADLVRLLHEEARGSGAASGPDASDGYEGDERGARSAQRGHYDTKGPLHGLVRNWFEFLDATGRTPSLPDILSTCALRAPSVPPVKCTRREQPCRTYARAFCRPRQVHAWLLPAPLRHEGRDH